MNDSIQPQPTSVDSKAAYYERRNHDGIKDTFESIIVALILAFVFRAFIVEAFVIPTGSMAPTLYGAHGTILCQDCGTEFAYGLRDLDDPRQIQVVRSTARAICPNCNHPNSDLRVSDDQMNPERGDRILVLKWPLDIGGPLFRPARWDVTVFKDPSDGLTNFIKRLVGLPGEVLMIVQGDVYTVPTADLSTEARETLDRLRHEKYELRTHQRTGRLSSVPTEVLSELDEKLRVARKTPAAQSSLWFDVYNHDHPPRRWDANQPYWHSPVGAKSGWDASMRRLRFTDRAVDDDYVELVNGNFDAISAYNIFDRSAPPVSDHRVSFVLVPESSTGAVGIRLSKYGRHLVASVRMDGAVSIVETPEPGRVVPPVRMSAQVPPFSPGKGVEIAFENVDYRLGLHVDGCEVLASSPQPGSSSYYGPNVRALRAMQLEYPPSAPRITGEGGQFELLHVLVQRDVHYFSDSRFNSWAGLPWAPREGWGSPASPILLRDGEYFMLGDNTAASKDSRLWDQIGPHLVSRGEAVQLGTVPQDQLIGKAFFVYWPSGHRIDWLPLFSRFGLIPDVGRMRWIR